MIPCLMIHSVGNVEPNWYRHWLSCDLVQFEKLCYYLNKNKFRSILLDEWYYLQDNQIELKGNEIVITFDDGYLDNLIYAFPILKKFGLQGTVFINPEFVDPSFGLRINQKQKSSSKNKNSSNLGFLNWDEIKYLDNSKVLDVQSHTMSHNFYFHENQILDCYVGQPNYDWLAWIYKPERKPFYLTEDQRGYIPSGHPIFKFSRALAIKRYLPDVTLINIANELYIANKSQKNQNFLTILKKNLEVYPGRFETDYEIEQRYRYELFESKKILETKLNKKVEFLCWPGGGYNQKSINLSIEAGYKASTIASHEDIQNIDNSGNYKRIQRFGTGSFMTVKSDKYFVKSSNFLIHHFKGRTGSNFYRNLIRLRKLKFILHRKLKSIKKT